MSAARLNSLSLIIACLDLENRYYQELSSIRYYIKVNKMENPREPVNIVYEMYNECETPIFREGLTDGNKPNRNPDKKDGEFSPSINA